MGRTPHKERPEFGHKLTSFRRKAGFSQHEAASRLGVSVPTIIKWETHGFVSHTKYIPPLADLYGISIAELFGEPPKKVIRKSPFERLSDKLKELPMARQRKLLAMFEDMAEGEISRTGGNSQTEKVEA